MGHAFERSVVTIFVAVALLLSRAAAAQQQQDDQTERARIHLKAAIAYYDDGRYDDAAREMQAAYQLKALPDLQYNLAQCYERLNKLDDAAKAYENYLAGVPEAPDRAAVVARIANLHERAKAAAQPDGSPAPALAPTEKVVFKTIVVYKVAPPPPGRGARYAAYGLAVLGAGALASGIAFTILTSQASNAVTKGGNTANPPPFDSQIPNQSNGRTYPIIAGISYGVAGLAAAGSVALFMIGRKIDREAPKLSFAPSVGPGGGGLFVRGRF